MSQLFELVIVATGEVRDADGNLVGTEPVEATAIVTAEQAAQLTATNSPHKESG